MKKIIWFVNATESKNIILISIEGEVTKGFSIRLQNN